MKNVLLLKTGTTSEPVLRAAGDYDRWFISALAGDGHRWTVVQLHLEQKVPEPVQRYDAVLITGSPQSLTQPVDWMKRAATYVRDAADRRVPVLGVCFGHQLLGFAYGVPVVRNPLGREIGSVQVHLTPQGRHDPLFTDIPASFIAQTTHEDILPQAPEGAEVLATNGSAAVQAMALGRHVRGVQFHPELSPEAMRATLQARAPSLRVEAEARGVAGGERMHQLFSGLQPSPHGSRLLRNFLTHFC